MITKPSLRTPGLIVTATDTGVGKTVVTCAIAAALRKQLNGGKVGVCKPFASGCRHDREGLVSEDAEALAHFADCRQPLDVINPLRFLPPLAPAVAAEQTGRPIAWDELSRSLSVLDDGSDALLIEGVGGLLVPVDPADPGVTFLDLVGVIGYPVIVVARSVLGTLNHTAMTVRLLREAGARVAGVVMNGYDADAARHSDPSMGSNRVWIERMTGVKVIAMLPQLPPERVQPQKGILDPEILEAIEMVRWRDVLRR
jgi:dethiobiotin synthetase